MRPQARPFTVELKTRNRATQPTTAVTFTRPDDWLDLVPPDDLPERDAYEDRAASPAKNGALREAEKVFSRIGGGAQAVQAFDAHPAPVTIAEPARRVLPDLLAAAREQERASIGLRKRAAMRAPTTQRRTKADHQPVTASSVPTPGVEREQLTVAVSSRHAEAAIALSRRNPGRSKLPAGQRWKERRLPKVCWARKLPRT